MSQLENENKKDKDSEILDEITDHKIINNSENKIESKIHVNNDISISDGLNNCIGIDRSLLSRIASTASACESQVSAVPVVYNIDGTDVNDVKFSLSNQLDSDTSSDVGTTATDSKTTVDELTISKNESSIITDDKSKEEPANVKKIVSKK